jgi:hypothetical protein
MVGSRPPYAWIKPIIGNLFCGVELLAEVPIAARLGRIGPIPAQVEGWRRRHSIGGDDGAQCDTVKDGPVVGLMDPRPHRPHDRGGFHSNSDAPAHRNMGPTGCDASMSNCDVPGSDCDASVSGCDVMSSDDAPTGCDASMSNCDVPASDRDASVSGCDVMSSDDASMPNRDVPGHPDVSTECDGFHSRYS